MYLFTVIFNEYLGQYFHRLVNFNFYEIKVVRQEEGLHVLTFDIYIRCSGFQFLCIFSLICFQNKI